ncbi:MAG: hypothetical protein WBK77_08200 [Alphaproteobacteria bacterium]
MSEQSKIHGSTQTLDSINSITKGLNDLTNGDIIVIGQKDIPSLEQFQTIQQVESRLTLGKYYLLNAFQKAYPSLTPQQEEFINKNAEDILEAIVDNSSGLIALPTEKNTSDTKSIGILIAPTGAPISHKSPIWELPNIRLKNFPTYHQETDRPETINLSFNKAATTFEDLNPEVSEALRSIRSWERAARLFDGRSMEIPKTITDKPEAATEAVYQKVFARIKENLDLETDIAKKLTSQSYQSSLNIVQQNPRLYAETVRQLQKERAFDNDPSAKQEAELLLKAADKYMEFTDGSTNNSLGITFPSLSK